MKRHRHTEIFDFSPQAAMSSRGAELNSATIFQGFTNSTDNRFSACKLFMLTHSPPVKSDDMFTLAFSWYTASIREWQTVQEKNQLRKIRQQSL
jgi:hypothetical protein